jgi:hypothetical protein
MKSLINIAYCLLGYNVTGLVRCKHPRWATWLETPALVPK